MLNINNLRDIDSDRQNGKNTLAVRLGPVNARRYHACLLLGALLCLVLFNLLALHSAWGWLFILATPLLVKQARYVLRESDPLAMRPMLEKTVKGPY
ncbi:1,4-dihydroxy-2-naphthoate octaprenyltransferase [Klebsiella aerogenes]|nr:1,4-dihydroxy-2-naphthoate octaprenyltransferase [Klebsiella aerogenes]